MTEYKTYTGMIYAVRQQPEGGWRIMCRYPGTRWELATDPHLSAECGCAESLQEVLDAYAHRRSWAVYEPAGPCDRCKCKTCGDNSCMQAHCDGSDHGFGCMREDGCYVSAEPAPANTTAEPAAGGSEPEERALAANPVTYDLSAPGAFDFGADAETNAGLFQDAQIFMAGSMARVMAAKHAHDLTANNYRGSWGKWCQIVGISRDTGDNMVRVAEQFGNIQVEGKDLIGLQPLKLLYAASKPSTPPEVRQKVETLDITSYKQYQDLLTQLKAKSDELAAVKAEADRRAEQAKSREEEARAAADHYHEKYEEANAARNAALDAQGEFARRAADAEQKATRFAQIKDAALDQVKQAQAKLEAERSDSRRAAAQLQQRIRELEARPVEVVAADPDEVNRLAEEKAQAIAAQRSAKSTRDRDALQERIEELEELLDDAAQDQIANTQALAVQAVAACDGLMESLFGKILFLPDKEYLPAKRIVESFYAKLGWVLDNNDWPDNDDWALNHSGDESDDEPDEEEAEEDE